VSGPLLVADVPWLLYRSFFALPRSITDDQGHPVNALLGTVNALLAAVEALRAEPPRAVVACMGAEEAAYRVRLYPGYHAHRDPMPAELARQWELAPGLLGEIGWTVSASDDLEADDVMFSHARQESEDGGSALLVSGDRDLYGAVGDDVAVLELRDRGKPARIGVEGVRERLGVEPGQVADLIALRGDPSDGIPGAAGVGAKTAAALLGVHGTLEAVLDAAQAALSDPLPDRACRQAGISPRIARVLAEQAAQLRDFKLVATLQRIPVETPSSATPDWPRGAAAARKLGMRRLAERLQGLAATA
jgi:DNA polymerase-1